MSANSNATFGVPAFAWRYWSLLICRPWDRWVGLGCTATEVTAAARGTYGAVSDLSEQRTAYINMLYSIYCHVIGVSIDLVWIRN